MDRTPLGRVAELAATVVGRDALLGASPRAVVTDLEPVPGPGDALRALPLVVVGIGTSADPGADLCDVVVPDVAAASRVTGAVGRAPLAATALALLLRGAAARPLGEGLVAESATYSALQAGPEHQAWLAGRVRGGRREGPRAAPVRLRAEDGVLRIELDRPHVRNALDAEMRDALLDALAVAQSDTSLRVELSGRGPNFCSGGDLAEFGSAADPASAHALRLARSVGLALAGLADRVTAHVHGACAGSGVELAAFAGRVVADPATTFALPELSMGLVPGAGGTVSVTGRVGRHRTAWLALTGARIDARTALDWGLVDDVVPAQAAAD